MHPWQTNLVRQLEELRIIQYSLLPGESFTFILTQEDRAIWTSLLDVFTNPGSSSGHEESAIAALTHPPCQARFEIRAAESQIWFEITLPRCTDIDLSSGGNGGKSISISVKGEHVSRNTHERWNADIRARIAEIDEGSAFPVYELLAHLIPILHPSNDSASLSSEIAPSVPVPVAELPYHALLTSHHLVSPTKRRTMQQLSTQLGVTGFAKVGYPGIMYVEGLREAVEAFVRDIKAMQWLALRVRFVEPVPERDPRPSAGSHSNATCDQRGRWVEVSKIGEVLELMKERGREALVTNLGIGASSKDPRE